VKSIATGFFAMATVVSVLCISRLALSGDAWLGLLYLLILIIPLSGGVYLWRSIKRSLTNLSSVQKMSFALFSLQGVALACWAYDLTTTFYAIDISRAATEINPLGWPLGALGAFSYYAPTVILTYILLFKLKAKVSIYAAIPITLVALLMGSMNFSAGTGNFVFFIRTAFLSTNVRNNLLAVVASVDVAYAVVFLASVSRKRVFSSRKLNPWKKT
jgi:hypothetical protein